MVSSIPIEYKYLFNRSFWFINRPLKGTIFPGLNEPGSNENTFHPPHMYTTGASARISKAYLYCQLNSK